MRRVSSLLALAALLTFAPTASGQAPKTSAKAAGAASHRTLTGKLGAVKEGGQSLTMDVAEGAAKSWTLGVGKQTLLLTANKNGQYSRIEAGDLKKGDTAQAVVDLAADGAGGSHKAWWLIVYPNGTTPPAP